MRDLVNYFSFNKLDVAFVREARSTGDLNTFFGNMVDWICGMHHGDARAHLHTFYHSADIHEQVGAFLKLWQLSNQDQRGRFNIVSDPENASCTVLEIQIDDAPPLRRAVNLSGAELHYADMANIDLTGVSLVNVKMHQANLNRATLTGVMFRKLDLQDADLGRANLARACLVSTRLNHAQLVDADLNDALLENVSITGARFDGARLKGARITLAFPEWSPDNLDLELNHLNNGGKSILSAIDSIDSDYNDLKLNLMHQVIHSLGQTDVASVHKALLAIWLKNPIYCRDPEIAGYVKTRVVAPKVAAANTGKLDIRGHVEFHLLADLIGVLPEGEKQQFMLKNNGFFVQLILHGIRHRNEAVRLKAMTLYGVYLATPQLEPVRSYLEQNGISELHNIDDDDPAFGFVHQEGGSNYSLVLSKNSISAKLALDKDHNWNHIAYFRNEVGVYNPDMATVYRQFGLFADAYAYLANQAKFGRLFETFWVSRHRVAEGVQTDADFATLFADALSTGNGNRKLCDPDEQSALTNVFSPLLEKGISNRKPAHVADISTLEKAHFATVLAKFEIQNASASVKAQHLLILAAVFSKLSSVRIFGTENDSPVALRYYAAGLMQKAHELAPEVFGNEDNYESWMSRMVGLNDAFTCSAVLSNLMIDHIKTHRDESFRKILHTLKPPGW